MGHLSDFGIAFAFVAASGILAALVARAAKERGVAPAEIRASQLGRNLRSALLLILLVGSLGIVFRSALRFAEALPASHLADGSPDVLHYREAANGVAAGRMPWRDFFFEYPPTAAYLVAPPAVGQESSTPSSYARRYTLYTALVVVLGTLVLSADGLRRAPALRVLAVFASWSLLIGNLGELGFLRMEPIIGLLALGGFGLALRSEDRRALLAAGVLLGLAAAKLYPALFVLAAIPLVTRRRGLAPFLAGFALGLLPLVVPAALGLQNAREFLRYHTERHIEIGSLFAVLFRGAPDGNVQQAFGSNEWRFAAEGAVGRVATVLTIVATAAPIVWLYARARRIPPAAPLVLATAGASLAGFVLFNKVGSPQYALWLLGAASTAALLPGKTPMWRWTLGTSLVIALAARMQMIHFDLAHRLDEAFLFIGLRVAAEAACWVAFLVAIRASIRTDSGPVEAA